MGILRESWTSGGDCHSKIRFAGCQRLTPAILDTQEAEIRRIVKLAGANSLRLYLENTQHKTGLVEWLKV
jgi:hypothetical protein